MLTSVRPIGVRRFPSKAGGAWSCTECGAWSRVDRSWTVEVEAVGGRRFCIVLCEDCVTAVSVPLAS